jgi:hypothetical protein
MADKPPKSDEKTPPTEDTDELVHPDGMNPHIVPEKASAEKQADEDDA